MTTKNYLLKKVIRAKCLDCMVYQPKEVRLCEKEDCANHRFRFGFDPEPTRKSPNPRARERRPGGK